MTTTPVDTQPETVHEAADSDQQVSTREVPWMKLGRLVDVPMTAREAAEAGGLDFTVSFHEIEYVGSDGERRKMPSRRVVERDDTHLPIGVVSSTYTPLQYGEAFDFMDTVGSNYVAAGALRGGRQGFMVATLPNLQSFDVLDGEDPHDLFAVLRTSHDCTRAVEVSLMPLRGRCMNQLTLRGFSAGAHYRVAVHHSKNMAEKLKTAHNVLVNATAYVAEVRRTAHRLAERQMTDEHARHILQRVIRDRPQRDAAIDDIITRWHSSPTVGYDGNGWGLVNAVSDFYEWGRTGGTPASRFIGAVQGTTHMAINRTATLVLGTVAK